MRVLGAVALGYVRWLVLLALLSFGLTFPGIAAVPLQAQGQAQGIRGGGAAHVGPGKPVHVVTTRTAPSTGASIRALATTLPSHRAPRNGAPPLRSAVASVVRATASATTPVQTTLPGMGTPSNLTMLQSATLDSSATSGQTGVTDDPSVVNVGNDIFFTGNFYAALSTDGGNSFSYIDPYTVFPNSYNGFCCDQQVIYLPSVNLVVWALLYLQDGSGNNAVRVAITDGSAGLESGNWTYFDFTDESPPPSCLTNPGGANCPQIPGGTGVAFDYPQLAYSANDFYLTANLGTNSVPYQESIIFRCPLTDLAAHSVNNCDSYFNATGFDGTDAFTPVATAGSSGTMYWADHADYSNLTVYAWPEGQPWTSIVQSTVPHSTYPTNYTCTSPDGNNLCQGEPFWSPVHGGWLNGNVLAFQWDAGAGTGGLGTFPYPYIHVVEINASTMQLIDEPIIWSSSLAYAYGGSGINQSGGVAMSVAYSGPLSYPGAALMIRDNRNPGFWQPVNVREGTSGPPSGLDWGDYLSAAPGSDGQSWVAASYILQGSCSGASYFSACGQVQPLLQWFVRPANAACSPPPVTQWSGAAAPVGSHRLYIPLLGQNACFAA
jgi:hypothetical protein